MVPGSLREGGHAAQITAAVNRVAMHRHSDGACAYTLMHTRTVGACTGRNKKKKPQSHTHTHSQMWTCQTEMNTNQNRAYKHKSDPENEGDRERSTVPSVKQVWGGF